MSKIKRKISLNNITALTVIISLIVSGILYATGDRLIYTYVLRWVLFFGALPIIYEILHNIYCKKFGVDLIAGVAITATFLFGEYLAGIVVLLMLSGGQTLEEYAFNRARRDLSALLLRAPHTAHVKKDETLVDTPIEDVGVGMVVTIKAGEVVSVDGVVVLGRTTLDESILTGESIPVEKSIGSLVYSGTINTNGTIDVRVTKSAKESKYSHIISLVEQAEKNRAPLVRLADRYSVYFTLITFFIVVVTWFLKHSITDVLAVLVVATPCPLILATPIAFISGINRAASRGVIVKNGGSLEKLAEAKTFVFDKTGTLTLGQLEVVDIVGYGIEKNTVLQIAASIDQFSAHTLVSHVQKLKIPLSLPELFEEQFGDGVTGVLNGTRYYFGKLDYIKSKLKNVPDEIKDVYINSKDEGKSIVFLSNNEKIIGYIVLSDTIREDSASLFQGLRNDGIKRVIMLTGDKKHVAEKIAAKIGITEVCADSLPDDKLNVIKCIPKEDRYVVMVGDGINDAPALALADVGIGLATHGKTATSDSADVVLISPILSRVRDLLHIARLTLKVAKEGIWIGIGLSIVCMIFASFGFIKPVVGALMQEGIDVLVILNALRVGRGKLRM